MDEADREREKHETRRLLYVAATRARDRLYLSSALKEGAVVPGRGSLGEVLPASIKELISKAGILSAKGGGLSWTSASGVDFEVRACPVPESADAAPSTRLIGLRDCAAFVPARHMRS